MTLRGSGRPEIDARTGQKRLWYESSRAFAKHFVGLALLQLCMKWPAFYATGLLASRFSIVTGCPDMRAEQVIPYLMLHGHWPLSVPSTIVVNPRQNMRNGTCCRLTRSDILPESWFLRVHFLYLPRQTHARVVGVRSALLSKSTVDRPCRLYCML